MRFILPVVALFFLGFLGFSSADLRFASSPKETRFAVRNRGGSVPFTTTLALYMEPSTFGYAGLRNQRNNNYDNFLRSNIDNEQDNRNFNTEAGKDHLPFRTLEAKVTDDTKQLPESIVLTVEPGKQYVVPLRWNNPHASEMEMNIWINDNTIVVPIKKPVCAGEGYQDGVTTFVVPTDFNDLGSKVQGFNGCQKLGDCTLQMYAHSVEPRTYAAGTPIIISGWDPSKAKATNNAAVQPMTQDPGVDLSKQPNDVCLPSLDPSANIANAVPRWARHVSDVYNHAYQNSDYSPYSGQQHEAISKNMQAAGILRMVNGNRGELGQSILTQQQKNTLAKLRQTADNIVKNYEGITNNIINQILKNGAKSTATINANSVSAQKLNNCFRCADTASVSSNRLQTNTYVPSFKINNQQQLAQARNIIQRTNQKYANLINQQGVLQIYVQALSDMAPAYQQLQAKYGLSYQPAMVKPNAATMTDATGFRKVNANGQKDGGVYAATQAKIKREQAAADAKAKANAGNNNNNNNGPSTNSVVADGEYSFNSVGGDSNSFFDASLNIDTLSGNEIELLSIEGAELEPNRDDDPKWQNDYQDREDQVEGLPIKAAGTDQEIQAQAIAEGGVNGQESSSNAAGMSNAMVAAISAAGGAAVVGVLAAAYIYKQKKDTKTQQTNNRVFTDARV